MTKYRLADFQVPPGFRGRPSWYVLLWDLVNALFFKPSPKIFYGWRRSLLRGFGAQIGKGVIIRPSVHIQFPWKVVIGDRSWVGDGATLYSLGDIHIGDNTVISQNSYLCTGTHDRHSATFEIEAHPIKIGNSCWIASDVFIGPGVTICDEVVVGARSMVFKSIDVTDGTVCKTS